VSVLLPVGTGNIVREGTVCQVDVVKHVRIAALVGVVDSAEGAVGLFHHRRVGTAISIQLQDLKRIEELRPDQGVVYACHHVRVFDADQPERWGENIFCVADARDSSYVRDW